MAFWSSRIHKVCFIYVYLYITTKTPRKVVKVEKTYFRQKVSSPVWKINFSPYCCMHMVSIFVIHIDWKCISVWRYFDALTITAHQKTSFSTLWEIINYHVHQTEQVACAQASGQRKHRRVYIFKAELFHLHFCPGHRNIVLILHVWYRYTCLPFLFNVCIRFACTCTLKMIEHYNISYFSTVLLLWKSWNKV